MITDSDTTAFELSLGRFVIAWADAELELYRVLIHYSNVSNAVARAIFSGTRAKGMIDFIRSIAHNGAIDQDRRTDLEHVFAQMVVINTMRDHVLHHVSDNFSFGDPSSRIVANSRTSRIGNANGYEIGPKTLDNMTWDLYAIANHLNMHWGPRKDPFQPWREDDQRGPPTAWLYRPLQPIQKWEATPPNPQSPQTRQEPVK